MGISRVVYYIVEIYTWLIFIRIILSWIRVSPYQPVVKFIYETTEPVLGFFRRLIPPVGMIDFSPLVALIAMQVLATLLVRVLNLLGIY
jgi:YggT family protein